jgi:hypothetical protein
MRDVLIVTAGLVLATAATAGEASFTTKPSTAKAGDKVRISFTVSAPTDVAVCVQDARGKVIRHLVAGMLGKNPPEPLKADSLEQTVEWDGRDDDGKVAEGGPFKVRVGLGLKANYAGPAFMEKSGPNILNGVFWVAVGPDARVMDNTVAIHVFRRDGAYEKTIKPYPSNLPADRLKETGAFLDDRGALNPLVRRVQPWNFYPFSDIPEAAQVVVADGKLWLPVTAGGGKLRLAAIDSDGGIASQPCPGPVLGPWTFSQPRLALGSDNKSLFVTGFGGKEGGASFGARPFVGRTKLPEQAPLEVAFGDVKQTGNDQAHLNEPRGLATDGQGHLLVCDSGNNRVVVLNEKDMSFAGSFEVPSPEWVGCHPKSGAVYVAGADALIKFSPSTGSGPGGGWKEPKEQCRLNLADQKKGIPKAWMWGFRRSFALDAASETPILWIGQNKAYAAANWVALSRCEDKGDKFTDPVAADSYYGHYYRGLTTDPYRREVACQDVGAALVIMDEETGKTRKLTGVTQSGGINRLGPDGAIYSNCHYKGIMRWDRDGKPKPFEVTDKTTPGGLAAMAGACGTSKWERDYSIDRKNDIYTHLTGTQYHGLMHIGVFGQDGKRKRTAIWGITDGGYGPRIDAKGNLYIMEAVKPPGEPFPAFFKPFVTEPGIKKEYDYMYGSIIKFGPQGGNMVGLYRKGAPDLVSLPGLADGAITNGYHVPGYGTDLYAAEKVALPDTAAKIKVEGSVERRNPDSYAQGAQWVASGASFVSDLAAKGEGQVCHCIACDFDVDDFGRTFVPDAGRFRVTVLDTSGNEVMHFGGYGNQDYWGPDSYVVDPATKLLRPRKADDPKDLKSPFAEPEIAFNQIIGLTVTDRYAYVADYRNRRVLRCKLSYSAEETCEVK